MLLQLFFPFSLAEPTITSIDMITDTSVKVAWRNSNETNIVQFAYATPVYGSPPIVGKSMCKTAILTFCTIYGLMGNNRYFISVTICPNSTSDINDLCGMSSDVYEVITLPAGKCSSKD